MATGCSSRSTSRAPRQATRVAPISVTPPAPAAAVPQARGAGTWYQVARGDTLSSISRRSGLSVGDIARANDLSSNLIRPDQRLWLPGVESIGADPLKAQAAARQQTATDNQTASIRGGRYELVPRRTWTTASVRRNHRAMGKVTRITIHHTGEHRGLVGLADVEVVRRIERYHRDTRKWAAIGYHYLVGKDGRIYEGRPAHIQGAHVSGGNRNNLGISCIGDYHMGLPNDAQLAALAAFLDDRRRHYGLSRRDVYGHRDIGRSICPGDQLYAWLQRYRRG